MASGVNDHTTLLVDGDVPHMRSQKASASSVSAPLLDCGAAAPEEEAFSKNNSSGDHAKT